VNIKRLLGPARVCALLVLGVLGSPLAAHADAPYDDRHQQLAAKVIAQGKRAEAAIDLLRMARYAEDVDPDVALGLYRRIASQRSVDVQHRVYAARRVAWDLRRTGDVKGSVQAFDALGYLRAFRVLGPFDNEGKRGFDTVLPPEEKPLAAVNLDATYQGRERLVRWRVLPEIVQGGYVSFDAVFRPAENVCALAETSLRVDKAGPISLWFGGGGATKVYFNGVEVLRDAAYRAPHPDRSVALVEAQAGDNRVLIKSCVTSGTWGFYLRVGDARGEPLVVAADAMRLDALTASPAAATKPRVKPPVSVLDQLERAASGDKPKAEALERLARFLSYTGSDDPAERRARQLALRAAELSPSASRYLFASALAEERYEKMRFIAKAEALSPRDPEVIIARARMTSTGPDPERALPMLDAVPARGVPGLEADQLRVSLLRQLGLDDSALDVATRALARAPRSSGWLSMTIDLSDRGQRRDTVVAACEKLLALREDHFGARRKLVDDAVSRQRFDEAIAHAEALVALFPADERKLVYAAEVYEAVGRDDLKIAMLHRALDVAPESEPLHVGLARALLRSGQTEAASDALRKALALKPQDAGARELLEQLAPAPRLDESYAIDQKTLLERRTTSRDHPVTILQSLTVNTVFDNGLGSHFVQFGAQAHDEEGARRLRARSIQFDPESQRVEVRLARVYRADGRVLEATETYEQTLGEPWYRMYYDTRALVVVFPDLEPGDSVELRYRVDDVAPRNLFADYYGDMHFFQGGEPRAHVEYVLITPTKRKFYFNEPKLAGLGHDESVRGEQRIDRFLAENVPALKPEPDLPGYTEIAAYLHVSTYRAWEDVGRWYWGLIQDQLYADESLKATVRELVRGTDDKAEIVRRIYGWVVKNTRYVALEFGIHGYLPYRVPDIVRRGFGDCKDKASLIYTMLREAGIEARIVLTRTRRNGAITDLPASLSVFDHAIAYVPELDLYLDGTAEHSGTRELPAADQGVTVLLVGPKDATLTKTPVLPSSSNQRTRSMRIELAADGAGKVVADESVAGVEAAGYRQTYQAEGTRKERFERSLSGVYPGLTLEQQTFTGLSDIEQDIGIRYSLSAPQLARAEGKDLRIAVTAVRELLREMAPIAERTYPLELGVRRSHREARTLIAPEGYVIKQLPAGGEVKSPFGRLSIRNEAKGREVVSHTELDFEVDRVPPKDYPAFRRFIEQADELLRQRVAFAPEKS
jgi:tetratricopeptide (TPR) repeat protein